MILVYDNYSRGYVVEILNEGEESCKSWLLLPAENLWPEALRGILYILALIYLFIGIAIASDVFMCSIEVITSKKRKVIRWDEERQEKVEKEVLIWNETVANLTLMALGSSAPEILLATAEMIGDIDSREAKDALGTFTIIGSAAFNLLIITAVCILSVPTGEIKSIKEIGVFVVTSIWSIWAYVWMLIVVKYITPGQIDAWEAWVTLGYLPVFVYMSYIVDRGGFNIKKKVRQEHQPSDSGVKSLSVRVVNHQYPKYTRSVSKELSVLEAEKMKRLRVSVDQLPRTPSATKNKPPVRATAAGLGGFANARRRRATQTEFTPKEKLEGSMANSRPASGRKPISPFTNVRPRARFRSAAVTALMGSSYYHRMQSRKPCMADVVTKVKMIEDAIRQGTPQEGDLMGKFTFVSDRFAVQTSAGSMEIDILFHRQMPNVSFVNDMDMNGMVDGDEQMSGDGGRAMVLTPRQSPTDPIGRVIPGEVTVEYETREGTAKADKDFVATTGTMTFDECDYAKVVKIPILQGKQQGCDVDFYFILKNPTGGGKLGDPSITRITIMDDDEPGEFLFEESTYYANMKDGLATVRVIREHGFEGAVSLEYSTIDGTAIGDKDFNNDADFLERHGVLQFEHGETAKSITIFVNTASKGYKNFILTIRNPDNGGRVGIRSAVVVHMNKGGSDASDELLLRVGELLDGDETEHITWGGQFARAMVVSPEKDEFGNDVPPKWGHYVMHFLTFFWKVFCAIIPPTSCFGAWPSFVFSLMFIGAMTCAVEELGYLLGCVVGVKTSVAGITIIALGTSVPDTFASRTAALQDEHADAAIGNVTGSNCVNVFLGLGLPWVLKTMHAVFHGYTFKVKTDNLSQGVFLFSIVGIACIITLLVRRKVSGGELGGSFWAKNIIAYTIIGLWCLYCIVISLHAYGTLKLPEF
ncbi:sodium/calcium exchanger 2-like [Babylonia areolata]|uniref:sodium/calcium exchanger 2-like n=1 Tax=Babylonia areolata TaxID=304850 RepID=UPI003FD51F8D